MELHEFIKKVPTVRLQMLRQALHYFNDADNVEDIVQESLVKLWMIHDRIESAEKMKHLAGIVVKNTSLKVLRDQKKMEALDSSVVLQDTNTAQQIMEEREDRQRLKRAINSLSDKERALIRMRNVENLSYKEIANVLRTTESSVRGMISKARIKLLNQMKEKGK